MFCLRLLRDPDRTDYESHNACYSVREEGALWNSTVSTMDDMDAMAAMGFSGFGKPQKQRKLDPHRFDKTKRAAEPAEVRVPLSSVELTTCLTYAELFL